MHEGTWLPCFVQNQLLSNRRTMDLLCLAYLSCSRIAAAMLQRPDAALVDYPTDCPRLWPLPKSPHNRHFTFLSTVASVLLAKHAPCNSASTMQLSSAGRSTTDPCQPVFVMADRVNQISVIPLSSVWQQFSPISAWSAAVSQSRQEAFLLRFRCQPGEDAERPDQHGVMAPHSTKSAACLIRCIVRSVIECCDYSLL